MISILVSGVVVFFTHALEAVTGFGCSVLAMPFVTALLGMRQGVIVITILAWILALYIVITKRKMIDFKQYAVICGCMLIGLPAGMYLFRVFDVLILKRILAVFIIVVSVWQLCVRLVRRDKPLSRDLPRGAAAIPYYAILVCGGIVHGMFSSGGPLAVIYASRALPDKGKFRATLCLLWATLNTVIIVTYLIEGAVTPSIAGTTGALVPFVIAGIVVGEKVHDKLDERIFSVVVFAMLLATGCFMLFL
ncbi:sulfite exporter TauE/SafE family protein [Breznakiella homolactica]|uniref:Probable membrane transporter protein n=1 Tax=Breznakiella homolactica TaxID=2798577 RepID=A0A7T7XRR3_9SPIR|nr:sulfite exporter TauE/SafE family protein [Breznakiella homolactica]